MPPRSRTATVRGSIRGPLGARERLIRLAERLQAPLATTLGRGAGDRLAAIGTRRRPRLIELRLDPNDVPRMRL